MQQIIVISIVTVCALWLAVQGYHFFRPKAGGKRCAGGCCDGGGEVKATEGAAPAGSGAGAPRTMMISSDDLRARLKARRS